MSSRIVTLPNPFHPDKLLLHPEQVATLARGEMIYPQTIEVDLTDGWCNQACKHCCFGSGFGTGLVSIDVDALIRALTEAYALGTRAVELVGGGEPTVHPKILQIIEAILQIGNGDMQVGLITNGLMAERVLPVAHRLTFLRVSLDTADPEIYRITHGVSERQFHKVVKNIGRLRDAMPHDPHAQRLGIGYLIVPPHNHLSEQILAGAELAHRLGADYVAYRPVEADEPVPQEQ